MLRKGASMRTRPRRKAFENFGVVTAVAALVSAPLVGTTLTSARAEAPQTVLALDFEDGTSGTWTGNGGTLSYPTDTVLQVANRTQSYDGLTSPEFAAVAGVTYSFSARAKLADGTPGTTSMRFQTGAPGYTWIANTADIGAAGWTTISGTWTPTADAATTITFGASGLTVDGAASTDAYTYLVDDLLITRPGAEAVTTEVVAAADFQTTGRGGWTQSGNPTLTDVSLGRYLSVAGRSADYHGIKSPDVTYEAGVEYTFSARARLAPGTVGTADLRFVTDPSYHWIGSTTLSAGVWKTVTGTWTPAEDTTRKVFLGAGALTGGTGAYTYDVDDIRVTRPAPAGGGDDGGGDGGDGGDGGTDLGPDVEVLHSDFESGVAPWAGRGGSSAVARTTTDAHAGAASMHVTGRSDNWHGAQTSIAPLFVSGGTYAISAWVRLAPGEAATDVKMTVAQTPDSTYVTAAPAVTVTADAWVQLTGTYTRAAGVTGGDIYFEAVSPTASFLVDDVTFVGPAVGSGGEWVPDLDGFVPGGAVNPTTTPVSAARAVEGAASTAALTFDDGPNGAYTTELLDFLAANDITATFCVIGQNITGGNVAILQRIVAEGHVLCNHGTTYGSLGSASKADVEADLKANLEIIRDALGDPDAEVPFFRAPNGEWGQTAEVAVALGMQPLAVVNTIDDWSTQDVTTLEANLRASMKNGQVVLVHDGGGNRAGSIAATKAVVTERLAEGWVFTLPAGGSDGTGAGSNLDADFEDGTLQGWSGRDNGKGAPTVEVVSPGHDSQYAARVSDRISQGQGIQHSVAGIFEPGATYDFSAWIKFEGEPGDVTLSAHVASGGSSSYPNLVQLPGMSNDWVEVSGTFTMPDYTSAAEIYFETKWAGSGAAGNTSTFLVDDISFEMRPDPVIQDLPSLQDAIDVPLGVAADSRETFRSAAELLTKHFTQVTPENSMKPENWYSGRTFTPNADTKALMDFAVENDLRVYGHVLVWHAQTPAWFFQDDAGNALPVNEASAQIVRQRMETHIQKVAQWMSDEYGAFGSATNPLVAWDVVNETIADSGEYADGMRRSDWYKYLGEEYIDDSFEYAEKYFNDEYLAPGADRLPLFINDYNSELPGKQQRYHDLVERMLDRGVPVDGVGHQFHVSLSLPVTSLAGALNTFSDLGLMQAVTELDVTTGTPVSEAKLIDQGYYYRDAFRAFREYEDQLFSVSVWGLYDTRSWRDSSGAPLVFDSGMQAKPAYHGIMEDGELGARLRSANVFAGDVALTSGATSDRSWSQLPLHDVDGVAQFQARWAGDHLTVYVDVVGDDDSVELQVGGDVYVFARDGSGDVQGVVSETDGGWLAVVHVPLSGAQQGDTVQFDLRVGDAGWNTPGVLGTLALVEPLSFTEVVRAPSVPTIDGEQDDAWSGAAVVTTDRQIQGTGGASATVRTMWDGTTLYVLADVADASVDTSSSAPYERDSVEIFLDAGNVKNDSYRYDDTQVRIDADNTVSVGVGDEAFQVARVESAATRTGTGYRVEAAISLLEYGGLGTFHGLDFQVNDATDGVRTAVRTWADPTGRGYQTPQRWGVAELVDELTPPDPEVTTPELTLSLPKVRAGEPVSVALAGFTPGEVVAISMGKGLAATGAAGGVGAAVVVPAGQVLLGSVVVAGDGTAGLTVRVPAATDPGVYLVSASVGGTVLADGVLSVLAAATDGSGGSGGTGTGSGAGSGNLATTGAGLGLGLLGLIVLVTGTALVVVRRRGHLAQEVGGTPRA